tara:strand:+ start:73 stop:420 length:348 start_codon:yes stop_codon:yes gene_type:complete
MKLTERKLKNIIRNVILERHEEMMMPVAMEMAPSQQMGDFMKEAQKCISMAHDGSSKLAEMCIKICAASERDLMQKCMELCMCACKCDIDGCCECLRVICQDPRCAEICRECCGC